MKTIRPVVKYHGGKNYLNKWIISHFPSDYQTYTYVEPFGGAASVLINKEKSPIEILSDTDLSIIQIFRALRDEPTEFMRRLHLLKYCEETFLKAVARSDKPFDDYLDHAVNDYTLRRMSRGGLKKAFSWSNRKRGGKPGEINAWETALEVLPVISQRIKEVYLFNNPALDIIKIFNNKNTLLYADPPYLPETRRSKNAYECEMTTEQHIELARSLNSFQGKVVLSGYPSALYARLYKDWNTETRKIANHSSQKKTKDVKTEIIYWNF
jgi:DNA adenine methylase